ncbi:MAG: copper chaperone PCu(A)C [bacterium]|nr:copper chaperone PCu(A)C [bacterium]
MKANLATLALIALATMGLSLSGCDKKPQTPQVKVSDFRARSVAAGAPTSAVYMTIENQGAEADLLLSAKAEGVEATELHETTIDEAGVMNMNKLQSIEIPANGTVSFAPGGLHVMLIGLKEGLKEGDSVLLDLNFKHAGMISLSVPVKGLAMANMPMDDAHKGMQMPMDDAHKGMQMPMDDAHKGMQMPMDDAHKGMQMPMDDAHKGMMNQPAK